MDVVGRGAADGAGRSALTRRELLSASGLFGLGAFLAGGEASASEGSGGWVAGTVTRVGPGELRVRPLGGGPERVVKPSEGAALWRDRPGVSPKDFRPGDEVEAEGAWEGERFVATNLSTVWKEVEGRIVEKKGRVLRTTGGEVRLSPGAVLPDGRGVLKAGACVWAIGRFDAPSRTLVAQKAGLSGRG